jgi:4-diphosphocytidyl-2-C-methyl-D-erythritol kinase
MILFPPAKINFGLRVLHRREDGFHEIDSCMLAIPFFDVLKIISADSFSFVQSGLGIEGDQKANLVVQAYNLVASKFIIPPVYIHLQKNIPMGAGLGGGSADATYTIIGLNQLFSLNLSTSEIQELSSELGSDCPFFACEGPQLASGRGEKLTPFSLNFKNVYLKIVNPGIHISTKDAFANVVFSISKKSLQEVLNQPISTWGAELKNDFESSVFMNHPELENIKRKLYKEGAMYASMTGSGSTLFAIYGSEPKSTFPNYFERIMRL